MQEVEVKAEQEDFGDEEEISTQMNFLNGESQVIIFASTFNIVQHNLLL